MPWAIRTGKPATRSPPEPGAALRRRLGRFAVRSPLRRRVVDHVFHEAGYTGYPPVAVVPPSEASGVQKGQHLVRILCMLVQQIIQLGVGHPTTCISERYRHTTCQRQGVRLAEFVIALPVVHSPRDARCFDRLGDMLRQYGAGAPDAFTASHVCASTWSLSRLSARSAAIFSACTTL